MPTEKCDLVAYSITKQPVQVLGTISTQISLCNKARKGCSCTTTHIFYAVPSVTHEVIVEMDFLNTFKAILQVEQKLIRLKNYGVTTVHILFPTGFNQPLATARIIADIEISARTVIKLLVEAELSKSAAGLIQETSLLSSHETVFNKHEILMPYASTSLTNNQAVVTVINPIMGSFRLHKEMSVGYLSDIETGNIHCFVQQPKEVTSGRHTTVASIKTQDKITLLHFLPDIDIGKDGVSQQDINYLKQYF